MNEPEKYILKGNKNAYISVIGCGGTGGYVAEGLCRLLTGSKNRIYLVDFDRVEERNIGRQNFYPEDLGHFKAKVLAERLARQFNRVIHYTVSPIEQIALEERSDITIGCVDNPEARERLQWAGVRTMMSVRYSYQQFGGWYIDAGNSENMGQVLIGNSLLNELNQSFIPETGLCHKLPLPTIQQPGLLAPAPVVQLDCAEAVLNDEQSPIINRMMADLVLTFVYKLLTGKLSWMAAYLNLETGSLATVDAKPEIVSRITGHSVRQIEYRPRPKKETVRIRV